MALPSFMSVYVKASRAASGGSGNGSEDRIAITFGTAFVVSFHGLDYLITNRHIVTGRDRLEDKPIGSAALPEVLEVDLPISGTPEGEDGLALIGTRTRVVHLYDSDGYARWLVHPQLERRVDVVAIPLSESLSVSPGAFPVSLMPYELGTDDPSPSLQPADEVSIVGFPERLRGGARSAIWVRGTIASEPSLPFEGEPCFLVDARTRGGQSGSPVIRRSDSYVDGVPDGSSSWNLIGVYAGRTSRDSDLGRIWKWSTLKAILEGNHLEQLKYE